MYATPSAPVRSASSPKVALIRDHRGSVARSTWGCRATRSPSARYSCRAMSANRWTSSAERSAASPNGSGHCETAPALNAVPGLSVKWCRGSVWRG